MIGALVRVCVQKRFAAVLMTLLVAAYGLLAYFKTPIEAYPDVTNVQVNVVAQMSRLAPEEIERQVTIPLERALNGTPSMIQMRSESLFGLSIIWCVFEDGADAFKARTRDDEQRHKYDAMVENLMSQGYNENSIDTILKYAANHLWKD